MVRPIERVQKAYVRLLMLPPEIRLQMQEALCLIRDEIAEQSGVSAEDVQNEMEFQAWATSNDKDWGVEWMETAGERIEDFLVQQAVLSCDMAGFDWSSDEIQKHRAEWIEAAANEMRAYLAVRTTPKDGGGGGDE